MTHHAAALQTYNNELLKSEPLLFLCGQLKRTESEYISARLISVMMVINHRLCVVITYVNKMTCVISIGSNQADMPCSTCLFVPTLQPTNIIGRI